MLAAAVVGASAATARGWGRPFRLAGPSSLDLIAPEIAFSPSGAAAVGFGVRNVDDPAHSAGFVSVRSPGGRLSGPRRVPGSQEILDLAYEGGDLELLVGASPRRQSCCSSAEAISLPAGGGFGRPVGLVRGLAGATDGRLVALPAGMLAAIGTERGVWVSQSAGAGGFGPTKALDSSALPETLAATGLPGGRSVVAWTARAAQYARGPRSIFVASGSTARVPQGRRVAITAATGHRIDELAVAPGSSTATLAWIESWYDRGGSFHSQAMVGDLSGRVRARRVSGASELASGIAFAADTRGDQALAWKACSGSGTCTARGTLRPAGRRFARSQRLGAIDAGQAPAVTVAPGGRALLGWIDGGQVRVAAAGAGARRFGRGRTVSRTRFGADLALAFGPAGEGLAVWIQGTLAQSVIGAVYRAR